MARISRGCLSLNRCSLNISEQITEYINCIWWLFFFHNWNRPSVHLSSSPTCFEAWGKLLSLSEISLLIYQMEIMMIVLIPHSVIERTKWGKVYKMPENYNNNSMIIMIISLKCSLHPLSTINGFEWSIYLVAHFQVPNNSGALLSYRQLWVFPRPFVTRISVLSLGHLVNWVSFHLYTIISSVYLTAESQEES